MALSSLITPLRMVRNGVVEKMVAQATTAHIPFAVGLTGGAGFMGREHGDSLKILWDAFHGFEGAVLAGNGTVLRRSTGEVLPSITEGLAAISQVSSRATLVGMAPEHSGEIISDEPEYDRITLRNNSAVSTAHFQGDWRAEGTHRIEVLSSLANRGWRTLQISYNGGRLTNLEVRRAAMAGVPVFLVAGSGRVTDELSSNAVFLRRHPNVRVVEVTEIQKQLNHAGRYLLPCVFAA